MKLFSHIPFSAHLHPHKPWNGEKVYFRGDDYFRDLLKAIGKAKRSVDFETYIFEPGRLGDRIIEALVKAVRRGVKVRLLVDGVGSPDFDSYYGLQLKLNDVRYRMYRSWPVFFSNAFRLLGSWKIWDGFRRVHALWNSGKHRDHRKLCVVDGDQVWIGSFNVSDWHLEKENGKKAWRDTGIRLSGVKSLAFRLAFHAAQEDPWPHHYRRMYRHALVEWLSNDIQGSPIRMTVTRRLRRAFRRELLQRIRSAQKRIWILTPYFVPTYPLLRALAHAGRRGCDVRLVLPGLSDVPMVRWASMTFYPKLLRADCRLYEYQNSVLHAKTLFVDRWVLVGSSNLDQRSLRKDLEINVVPQKRQTLLALERQYQKDMANSREITLADMKHGPPGVRFLSWLFFHFRYWF